MNVTPQIIVFANTNDCDISSQDLEPHLQNALKQLDIWHKRMDKISVHILAVHSNGAPMTSISFPILLPTQEARSKSKIKDTLCSQATCFVTKIRYKELMSKLKKHGNNIEFWCNMYQRNLRCLFFKLLIHSGSTTFQNIPQNILMHVLVTSLVPFKGFDTTH